MRSKRNQHHVSLDHPSSAGAAQESASTVVCDSVSRVYHRGESGLLGRGDDRPPVHAVSDVSLEISRGQLTVIAGASGSGKSTLLHLLAGLDTPTDGTVTVAGEDTSDLSRGERAALRLDHVGIVFQRFHLLPALTAQANVGLPLIERGVSRARRRQRAASLLEDVGMGDRLDHKPGELSGGEQQRVAVARALSTDPELLIADEPTGELDTETGQQIIDILRELAADRAVVVATHDHAVMDIADRMIQLQDGSIDSDTVV